MDVEGSLASVEADPLSIPGGDFRLDLASTFSLAATGVGLCREAGLGVTPFSFFTSLMSVDLVFTFGVFLARPL